jgi:hypothetical protein
MEWNSQLWLPTAVGVSRMLVRFVARVIIANPLQVKAIAQAHLKTGKIDAGALASLEAAGYLPPMWKPDAATERKRRSMARRYRIVRHRMRLKKEVALDPACAPDPEVPACRSLQRPRQGVLADSTVAG